jgi:xylem cysteine proteinase
MGKNGKANLAKYAEQHLVSCDTKRDAGCNGGNVSWANTYLKTNALSHGSDYAYTSGRGQTGTCNTSKANKGCINVVKSTAVARNQPKQLKSAIANAVVAVAIQADKRVFQTYQSGVITGSACGTQLDHAVAAVGYGVEKGVEYFLVRNSWAASWGDKGYVKIGIESGAGVCGINKEPEYVTKVSNNC